MNWELERQVAKPFKLTLTYLLFKNWFFRRKITFSNYHLYGIPYLYINNVNQFDLCKEGFFGADEIWQICDSRLSLTKKNRFVASILGRSRKRHLNITFTAQLLDQLDKRIRKVVDFTAYAMLNPREEVCKVSIFRTGYPTQASYMKTFYFFTEPVFKLYSTDEEIDMNESDEFENPPIIFQETEKSEPEFFDKWEDADLRAEKFWMTQPQVVRKIFGG